jgi:multiple sugar transport system ATP-binding protein
MNGGTIQQLGPPMEVYDWPANRFVAGFIGTPAMNFVEGTLMGQPGEWQFRRGAWSLELSGARLEPPPGGPRPAGLGVRPEHISLETSSSTAAKMHGRVRLVEMLGDATVVTLEIAATEWDSGQGHIVEKDQVFDVQSKAGTRADVEPGDVVGVRIDTRHAHLFDPQTGENWARPRERARASSGN